MATTERILNCEPSKETDKDWGIEDAAAAGMILNAPVPDSYDLRATWWKVGDQGSTGSCVGWATGDSVIRWHLVQADRLPKRQLLSVRYIWMAAKETDEFRDRPTSFIESDGTSLKAALDIARKYGVVKDSVLAFGNKPLYQGSWRAFYAEASKAKVGSYYNLGDSHREWRKWLAESGPILTRLDVDDTWMKATSTDGKLETYLPDTRMGGHAVALVGYTPDGFIVRNSWGTGWGDKGFAYATNAYAKPAFTEAYGVIL